MLLGDVRILREMGWTAEDIFGMAPWLMEATLNLYKRMMEEGIDPQQPCSPRYLHCEMEEAHELKAQIFGGRLTVERT